MKLFLLITISILTLSTFGQIDTIEIDTPLKKKITFKPVILDFAPFILHPESKKRIRKPAFFINGEFVKEFLPETINPKQLDSIHIEKNEFELEGETYYGKILLMMKEDYSSKLIS